MFSKIISTALCILLWSCSGQNNSSTENYAVATNENVVTIPLSTIEKGKSARYSDLYDSIRLVKLETTRESLIGRIDVLLSYKNRFFVLDQVERKAVLSFDSSGQFLGVIGGQGKGPGEYMEPNHMAIDKYTDELIIWSRHMRKLIFFDLSGKFLRELKLDYYIQTFVVLSEDLFALYLDNGLSPTAHGHPSNLLIVDKSGNLVADYFNCRESNEQEKGSFSFFFQQGNTTLVSPGYSGNIYSISSDGSIKKEYTIDFGEHTIPKGYFTQIEDGKANQALRTSDYAYLDSYFDTPDFLVINFVYRSIIYQGFYSKRSKKFQYANHVVNNLYGIIPGGHHRTVDQNYVISSFDPYNIEWYEPYTTYPVDVSKIFRKRIDRYRESGPNEEDLQKLSDFYESATFNPTKAEVDFVAGIDPSDNPILLIKKLKPF